MATAVGAFLKSRSTACTGQEILVGLERGGFDFKLLGWQEKDRLRSLAMAIAKNTKTFHRLPNGTFGLLEWYPEVGKRAPKNGKPKDADEETADSAPESEEAAP